MIFLSAFSQSIIVPGYERKRKPGQFFEEYKYLLKSIFLFYPEATPLLYLLEGEINQDELMKIHPKLLIFDFSKLYKKDLGIDLNIVLILMSLISNPIWKGQNIVTLDTDSLIVGRFDEYIFDYKADITQVCRGHISWKGFRQDLVFGPGIYHRNNDDNVMTYLDFLFELGLRHGQKENDFWVNVQPSVFKIYEAAGVDTDIDFNGFPSHQGTWRIMDESHVLRFVTLKAVPQYVLAYPIQEEKYYSETKIIHYKNHPDRKEREKIFNKWIQIKERA